MCSEARVSERGRLAQDTTPRPAEVARTITRINLLLSALLFVGLSALHLSTASQSAFAQAIDSLADAMTAVGLLYVLAIAQRPADHEHVAGHGPAEPIAALVLAVLTAVMGTEVIRSAIDALVNAQHPRLTTALVVTFACKFVAKAAIYASCRRQPKKGPALSALQLDARNDVLTSSLALVGFFLEGVGDFNWDAWLAFPVGAWVIVSGFQLARENIRLLMGERASTHLHDHFRDEVEKSPDVQSCHDLVVRHHGMHLDVSVDIIVDPTLSLRLAHDIGASVRRQLLQHPDVVVAHVHLDVEDDSS